MLFPTKGEKDWSKSLNARVLESGLAVIRTEEELPDEAQKWLDVEEEAREAQTGVWQFGGDIDEDSD